MTNLDVTAFDFDNMVTEVGKDPFAAATNKYAEDERFYKLTKDKDGAGAALIRFLPDSHKNMIQQVYKINTTITKNDKKRFVNELSPATIGLPCPFQEKWQELWNLGDKEESKKFGRTIRYYTNIKVIKDPANPANEGKIFLLDMSGTLKDKIQKIVNPSQTDIDLGATAKQLFNPVKGNSFRLVSKKGSNGIINYDASDVLAEENSIYATVQDAFDDITKNTHDLSSFTKAETYLSYEKLQEKLKWVTFADAVQTPPVQQVQTIDTNELIAAGTATPTATTPVQEVQAVQTDSTNTPPSKTKDLDELLNGLM